MTEQLLLHERARADGTLERTWLEVEDGDLLFRVDGEQATALPLAVLDGVMRRYGKPLAEEVPLDVPRLVVDGRALSILRYRPRYDVIAKDYFVYAVVGGDPVAELATAVAAALTYLMRVGEPARESG
jgi:hypothetical protein